MWDEAWEGSDFSKHADFVDLFNDCIEDFSFKWSEDNSFIFNWVDYEALTSLDYSTAYVDNCCDGNDKAILSRACSFYFSVEFLADSV